MVWRFAYCSSSMIFWNLLAAFKASCAARAFRLWRRYISAGHESRCDTERSSLDLGEVGDAGFDGAIAVPKVTNDAARPLILPDKSSI